ncbi:LCP family protein [Ornithinibacillus sp. BX22]|uniref:LCP family protein n=2 Tax=Ornithinibacillus TaxID=484508 RepID=A0A923RFZ7_9BACI|nr:MULTISPECIES: LCP family protein [Ornithinibacillus]MBC5635735.1 LCP family protein [Ornithinibacillus hominis]MBS3679346.1 LCP family protein [Ornithinibacillus massiliensis]
MSKVTKPKKKMALWKKIVISVLAVLLVAVVGGGVYAYSIYSNAKKTVNEHMYKEVVNIDREVTKQKVENLDNLNILLVGLDARANERGRSDTLMILSLYPDKDQMQLVSIPRDTRTMIVGKGYEDKINHAYAFGGIDMSIATVENLLDIELDYYVEMNMEGLTEFIDELGGITVQNELDWKSDGYHYKKGELNLNGKEALGYVRMRKHDSTGDFGRTGRQRQVVEAAINKGANIASIGKINSFIDILGNNMHTNMDFDDMKNLLLNYKDVRRNTTEYMLQGSGKMIDGIYYYLVPDEELQKVHGMIVGDSSLE